MAMAGDGVHTGVPHNRSTMHAGELLLLQLRAIF
jgi:hypothetical protein